MTQGFAGPPLGGGSPFGVILQDTDPGAVGAGREWVTSAGVFSIRNAANTGWIVVTAGGSVPNLAAVLAAGNAAGAKIANLTDPTLAQDAATKAYVDALVPVGSLIGASVATSQSTTSAAYVDLATVGPAVTITVPASGRVVIALRAQLVSAVAQSVALMAFALSGASTIAASDAFAMGVAFESNGNRIDGASLLITGLAPGVTTFTAKYRADGTNTATFLQRSIFADTRML